MDNPGPLSYTVVCNGCPGPRKDLVVSGREPGGLLDERMLALVKEIYGDLVPEATCHGDVEAADSPLTIYSMPFLRGSALIEVQSVEVRVSNDEEAKGHIPISQLARYTPI